MQLKDISKYSNDQLLNIIKEHHSNGLYSICDLAKAMNTYPNKLIRLAKRHNVPIDSKSSAQKKALLTGKLEHPTMGKPRPEVTRRKMSKTVRENWLNKSEKEKRIHARKSKQNYKKAAVKMNQSENRIKKIHEAAKFGSKLEVFLYGELQRHFSLVLHQAEHIIRNDKFHIDIVLPKELIAIEIDGPSHFEDIWGKNTLTKIRNKDRRKTAGILEFGYHLIRVINDKEFSQGYGLDVCDVLLETIAKIKKQRTKPKETICHLKK